MATCIQNHFELYSNAETSGQDINLQSSEKSKHSFPLNMSRHPYLVLNVKNTQEPYVKLSLIKVNEQTINNQPHKKLILFRPKKSNQKGSKKVPVQSPLTRFFERMISMLKHIISEVINWLHTILVWMVATIDTLISPVESAIIRVMKEVRALSIMVEWLLNKAFDFGKFNPLFSKFLTTIILQTQAVQKNKEETSKKNEKKELTLALDLDETLVHSSLIPLSGDYQTFMVRNCIVYGKVFFNYFFVAGFEKKWSLSASLHEKKATPSIVFGKGISFYIKRNDHLNNISRCLKNIISLFLQLRAWITLILLSI